MTSFFFRNRPAYRKDLSNHRYNPIHKFIIPNFSLFHHQKLILPFCCQACGFQILRHYMDQLTACHRRKNLFSFTFCIPGRYQFLNNISSGCRCPKSLFLCFRIKFLISRCFHCSKQSIFGKHFRRGSIMGTLLCFHRSKNHSLLISFWKFCLIIRFIRFLILHTIFPKGFFHFFKSHLHRQLSFRSKFMFFALYGNFCLFIKVLFPCCLNKLLSDQHQQIFLSTGKSSHAFFHCFFCRQYCMMIRYLCIINHTIYVSSSLSRFQKRKKTCHAFGKHFYRFFHIFGYILTVCSRIGNHLFFVQLLQHIQCLLGSVSKKTICFPLQTGQIIKFWWESLFLLSFYPCDQCFCPITKFS